MPDEVDVLVVDDDPDTRESLAMLLGDYGYRVRTAGDGPAALAAVEARPPMCVLLDLGLPGMSGIELARRIRADHEPNIVIISLTGWANTERQEQAESAGVDYVLAKPLDLKRFSQLLPPLT
jgi:CheY-like chemotaxis protein